MTARPIASRKLTGLALALGLTVVPGATAHAMDLTLVAVSATPAENWGTGWGGALGSTFFEIVSFEGEVARIPVETGAGSFTSFTASALVSPPVGRFIPYGGIGVGVFRQTLSGDSDTGRLRALIVGLKVRLGLSALVKGEYRAIDQSGEPVVPLEHRFSAGIGISF